MSGNERLRDKWPMLNAYGGRHVFFDTEGALAATADGRIRSVWPYLVRRVLAFCKGLKPRERTNYDAEDVIAELYLALAEKDAAWAPERGKYITFAAVIIDRELCAIRDKARTVQSPRNSCCRMKKYRQEEVAGTLTDRRRMTADDIRRTGKPAGTIGVRNVTDEEGGDHEPTVTDDPLAALVARERAAGMRAGLREALQRLSPIESEVITRLSGLDGCEVMTFRELTVEAGRSKDEVRRAKERAMLKIRQHVAATKHSAFIERN